MNEDKIKMIAKELSGELKTPDDINQLAVILKKLMIKTALNTELAENSTYSKNQRRDVNKNKMAVLEDRFLLENSYELETSIENQVMSLYMKGMTNKEIVVYLKENYAINISVSSVTRVTDSVIEQVIEWQNRTLDSLYPIIYFDCLVVKVRQHLTVINKAIYLALAVNMDGQKELLGIWISQNEGAKFWLSVMTELKNRGIEDILIACVDGLKGFPDAINAMYPYTDIQLCLVHIVRNSLRFVSWKDYRKVATGLKSIYHAPTEDGALIALNSFCERWDYQYPKVGEAWKNNWEHIRTLFTYPSEIRYAIYTTNAIESLNSVMRRSTKKRKIFSCDDSAKKVIFLAATNAAKNWKMPIKNWRLAMNWFTIHFDDCPRDHL